MKPPGIENKRNTRPVVFEIIPEELEVRLIIDEVLNGSLKTVVGATNQVVGQADFNISIPQVRSVTAVNDEVVLEIDYVAEPV